MSYRITSECVNCWACEPVCPNQAVVADSPHFRIAAESCTGCEGDYADPQCASICPIEGAILDPSGQAVNPAGSLTGIPPTRVAAAQARIQQR